MFDKKVFGLRLKNLRKINELSQSQVAELLGVTRTQISDLENGKTTTSIEKLNILADYFNVPADYLLGRGFFRNWDDLMKYKGIIIPECKEIIRKIFTENPQYLDNPGILNLELELLPDNYLANLLPHLILDYKVDTENNEIDITWLI